MDQESPLINLVMPPLSEASFTTLAKATGITAIEGQLSVLMEAVDELESSWNGLLRPAPLNEESTRSLGDPAGENIFDSIRMQIQLASHRIQGIARQIASKS